MIVFPNAKINIGLDIVRRRHDGYHDLETVMMPVPWCDILEIVPARGDTDSLTVTGRGVDCPPGKNLVMKAVRALREVADFGPVDIYLEKIIPDGAGLGGGSADAAFTLACLDELFGLGLPKRVLAETASRIGADCPFFIYNNVSLCTGTGTDIKAISLHLPSPLWIAIVKPDESVSTREAYAGVTPHEPATRLMELLHKPLSQWQGAVKNDFEASIFPSHPAIAGVKQALTDMGAAYASMSGSGSAVYALFDRPGLFKPSPEWNCYLYKQLTVS